MNEFELLSDLAAKICCEAHSSFGIGRISGKFQRIYELPKLRRFDSKFAGLLFSQEWTIHEFETELRFGRDGKAFR